MLNAGEQTHPGMLPQSRALESHTADNPGRGRNGCGKSVRSRTGKTGIQPARGERSAAANSEPSPAKADPSAAAEWRVSANTTVSHSYVFVFDRHGEPLMPCHPARARKLLASGRARVHHLRPFVIRLVDRSLADSNVQPVNLSLDPGSKHTGIAICRQSDGNARHVLYLAELTHRGRAIHKAMGQRAAFRRGRRSRNLRYRAPRFLNRTRPTGWLPPSVEHRVVSMANIVDRFRRWLPVASIDVERVRFDMQLLENPEISGVEYQQGTLAGYEVREYLLQKFDHACAYCGQIDVPLQVEHVVPKARGGGNRVSNLAIACRPCNEAKGTRFIDEFLAHDPKRLAAIRLQLKRPLHDAAAVNATRYAICDRLREAGLTVNAWSGGRTKFNRTNLGLPKTHCLDAACVGEVGAITGWNMPALRIKADGRGSYKRTRLTADGFPRGYLMRSKGAFGFRTGDLVRAVVPKGKNIGTHTGRVAVRASGNFNIQGANALIKDVSHRHCRIIARADGYSCSWETAVKNQDTSSTTKSEDSGGGPRGEI